MRRLSSLMTLILVASVLLIGGVSAAWIYATGDTAPTDTNANIGMGGWEFKGTVTFMNEGRTIFKIEKTAGDPVTQTELVDGATADFDAASLAGTITDSNPLETVTGAQKHPVDALKVQMAYYKEHPSTDHKVDYTDSSLEFDYWMNAGTTKISSIDALPLGETTLYPSFKNTYTAMFVDFDGNVVAWTTYQAGDRDAVTAIRDEATAEIQKYCNENPDLDIAFNDIWTVHVPKDGGGYNKYPMDNDQMDGQSAYPFTTGTNVTIHPTPTYNGDVNLIPIDNNGDGEADEYQVCGYSKPEGQDLVVIPGSFNGKDVTTVVDNAFSSYDGVHGLVIPKSVQFIGTNVLATNYSSRFDSGETVTLYYEGSYSQWLEVSKSFTPGWDTGISESSRIFFLNGGDTVDVSEGYISYKRGAWKSTGFLSGYREPGTWSTQQAITQDMITSKGNGGYYYPKCNCDYLPHPNGITMIDGHNHSFTDGVCSGCTVTDPNDLYNRRPDYIYWGDENGKNPIEWEALEATQ